MLSTFSISAQNNLYLGGPDYPSSYNQENGSLSLDGLYLYPPAAFNLRDGEVSSSVVIIGQGDTAFRREGYEPVFTQWAGLLNVSGELVLGFQHHGSGIYNLIDGVVFSQTLRIGANRDAAGTFLQSGGTNQTQLLLLSQEADDPMTLPDSYHHSGYFMSDGALFTSETVVGAGREGIFLQSGGAHVVQGALTVGGGSARSSYDLSAGELEVQNLRLAGRFVQRGGTFRSQCTILFEGSTLTTIDGQSELGTLILSNSASLTFGTNSYTQAWQDSSALLWLPGARLHVYGWNGALNGGGMHQLRFGNNSGGLTPQQLSQIFFSNPAGLRPEIYPARILPSGEVVPQAGPLMNFRYTPQGIRIAWEGSGQLQSATTFEGPYVAVPNATSPYTNQFAGGPQRYFRVSY